MYVMGLKAAMSIDPSPRGLGPQPSAVALDRLETKTDARPQTGGRSGGDAPIRTIRTP